MIPLKGAHSPQTSNCCAQQWGSEKGMAPIFIAVGVWDFPDTLLKSNDSSSSMKTEICDFIPTSSLYLPLSYEYQLCMPDYKVCPLNSAAEAQSICLHLHSHNIGIDSSVLHYLRATRRWARDSSVSCKYFWLSVWWMCFCLQSLSWFDSAWQAGKQAGWLATTELQTLANANEREQSSQKKRQKNLDREGDEWSGVVV